MSGQDYREFMDGFEEEVNERLDKKEITRDQYDDYMNDLKNMKRAYRRGVNPSRSQMEIMKDKLDPKSTEMTELQVEKESAEADLEGGMKQGKLQESDPPSSTTEPPKTSNDPSTTDSVPPTMTQDDFDKKRALTKVPEHQTDKQPAWSRTYVVEHGMHPPMAPWHPPMDADYNPYAGKTKKER